MVPHQALPTLFKAHPHFFKTHPTLLFRRPAKSPFPAPSLFRHTPPTPRSHSPPGPVSTLPALIPRSSAHNPDSAPRPCNSPRVLQQVPDDHPRNDEKHGGPCADPDPRPPPRRSCQRAHEPFSRPKTRGIPQRGDGRGKATRTADRRDNGGGEMHWAGQRVGGLGVRAHPSQEAGSSGSCPFLSLLRSPADGAGTHPPPAARCSWHPRSTGSRSGQCGRQLGPREPSDKRSQGSSLISILLFVCIPLCMW